MITLIYQNNNQKIIIILEYQLKLHTAKLCSMKKLVLNII